MIWELRSWSPILDFVTSILCSTCICIRCAWKQRRIWVLSMQPKSPVWISTTSRREWNSIFQNFQREGNLARYTQILGNFFLSIQLCSRNFLNFRLSCLHFGNSTVSGIFLGNFCTICCCFQIFETFGSLNGKRLLYIDIKQRLMNKAEYVMKNYGDGGGCYPSRP